MVEVVSLMARTVGIFLVCAVAGTAWLAFAQTSDLRGQPRIIDGDTVAFGSEHVRFAGMDAPEMDQTCAMSWGAVMCGQDARQALIGMIAGREVRCDVQSQRDRYGRDIATCWAGDLNLNREMVVRGEAVAYWSHEYEAEEATAHAGRVGIWAGSFERPAQWRREHPHR